MDRRRFLVGIGAFAGTATLWKPEPTVFDMGRNTVSIADDEIRLWSEWATKGIVSHEAFQAKFILPNEASGLFWHPDIQTSLYAMRVGNLASVQYVDLTRQIATTLWQPIIESHADFLLPDGKRVQLLTP